MATAVGKQRRRKENDDDVPDLTSGRKSGGERCT